MWPEIQNKPIKAATNVVPESEKDGNIEAEEDTV